MSDVVAAALVAAGVGVTGNGLTTWVALATTARRARADAERLRDEHREADRRVRREAYARMLIAIERLDLLTSAYTPPPTLDAFQSWIEDFRAAGVGVRLVESVGVADARKGMGRLLDDLADEVMRNVEGNVPMIDALGIPYVARRGELHAAGRVLGDAMRDDLAFAASPLPASG